MNPPGRCEHCQRYHPPEQLRCPEHGLALPLQGRLLDGRYQLEERIALSTTARVWRARHRVTQGLVALKMLRPELLDRKALLERFLIEGKLGARVRSDEVITTLDLGQSDLGPFVVMEWVSGESLKEKIEAEYPQSGPWPFSKILVVAKGLARAMCAVHAQGIVHRDIKASNIMIYSRPDGELALKLGDFGVAKFLGSSQDNTVAGQLLGTPRYMPPEQRADAASVDERADLYAFGLTVAWMLLGPEADLEPTSWAKSARSLRWPPGLLRLLLDCVAQEPARRPASALQLLGRLDSLSARGSIAGPLRSEPSGPRAFRASRSFAMLVCALAGGAGGYAAAQREASPCAPSKAGPPEAGLWLDRSEAIVSPRCIEKGTQGRRPEHRASREIQGKNRGPRSAAIPKARSAEPRPRAKRALRPAAPSTPGRQRPSSVLPSLPALRTPNVAPPIRRPSRSLAQPSVQELPGLIAAGNLWTLAARVTAMGFFDARQYCRSLAQSKHLGVSGWRLAKTEEMARWSHVPGVRLGLYWTDDLRGSRAQVVGLPSNRRFHARLRRRFIRPFCVADRSKS